MKKTDDLPYQSIALCGYRQRGRKIYAGLVEKGIKIPYIIERNYQALSILEKDLQVPIVGFGEEPAFYHSAEAILLIGDLPEEIVRESLELAKIDLPLISDIEVQNVFGL